MAAKFDETDAWDSRVNDLFLQAIEILDEPARNAFLNEQCGDDVELRKQIDSMLVDQAEAVSFFDQPNGVMDAVANLARTSDSLRAAEGTVIDRYKLLQRIGEGGFGVVYMAEQQQPVQRQVAVKVIKPGMDTNEIIARFEAERQALAMMDHPNICKVLDGGVTEDRRPYFVMELVKGIPITEFCDKNNLDTRSRLHLFVQVCAAVQHAHHKGVIHRDLKPANVLISLHDGKPLPKIIDFGIAKAVSRKLTEKTLFTRFGQMIGTPQYMSPEQAEMSGLDVDTRSDVYSLGVLLYELLTGKTPLSAEQLRTAAYAEIVRLVQEQEPPMPSRRISDLNDELAIIARRRGVDAQSLRKMVHGDLDWIVMKALDKDRNHRYDTASRLADDIQRHLDDEPVQAGPPGSLYRLKKIIRRNRAVALTAATVLIALATGSALATVGFLKARYERDQAILARDDAEEARNDAEEQRQLAATKAASASEQARRSEAVLSMLEKLLLRSKPDRRGGDFLVREMVDEFALRLDEHLEQAGLTGDKEVESSIRHTLGTLYFTVGNMSESKRHLRRAHGLSQELYPDDHPKLAWLRRFMIFAFTDPSNWSGLVFEAEEVASLAAKARPYFEKIGDVPQLLVIRLFEGFALMARGRFEEAESAFSETLKLSEQKAPHSIVVAQSQVSLAFCIRSHDASRLEEVASLADQIIESDKWLRKLHASEPGIALTLKTVCLYEQGQYQAAAECAENGFQSLAKVTGVNSRYYVDSVVWRFWTKLAIGEHDEAVRAVEETIAACRNRELLRSEFALSRALFEYLAMSGDEAQVDAAYQQLAENLRRTLGEDDLDTVLCRGRRARLLTLRGDTEQADEIFAETLPQLEEMFRRSKQAPLIGCELAFCLAFYSASSGKRPSWRCQNRE